MAALDELPTASRETQHHSPTRAPPSRDAMAWDGVRVFLAIARERSMRAAGRALGLSQPTIARRLTAFEASFGAQPLFDRLPEGVRLNTAGEQLLAAAEVAENAMLALERRRAAASPLLRGTVRVSAGECAAGFLARCLSGGTTAPLPSGITLELLQPLPCCRRSSPSCFRRPPAASACH
jgi:DNA-binding transcriptional LysR family regulator